MVTECKNVKYGTKKSVNKPFLENISMRREYIQNFLAPNFDIFQAYFFWQSKFETNRETKVILEGSGGMLPPKNVCKLTYCNEHFSAFRTICNANFVLLPLISSSPNLLHFVRIYSIYAWLKVCLH